jgi:HK97 family phage major capsid protein
MVDIQRTVESAKRAKTPAERRDFERLVDVERDLRHQIEAAEARRDPTAPPSFSGRGLDSAHETRSIEGRTVTPQMQRDYNAWLGQRMAAYAKGEARDLSESTSGFTVPTEFAPVVFETLTAKSIFLASGVQTDTISTATKKYPVITPGAASWVAEAGALSEADGTPTTITATPQKVARLVYASYEAVADGDPMTASLINTDGTKSIALALDLGFYEGAGHGSHQPLGLAGQSSILTSSYGTNGAIPANLDELLGAQSLVEDHNGNPSQIAMSPTIWAKYITEKDSQNRYQIIDTRNAGVAQRSVNGSDVSLSSQFSVTRTQGTSNAASNVYVYDPSVCLVTFNGSIRIEMSKDARFTNDQLAFRFIVRADLNLIDPKGVCVIAGALSA